MSEEKPKPAYYGILPASVRYDKSLHPNAKIIYTEISSLCNKEGYCWASNNYFAELFDVTARSVINWINNLREKKYIRTELIFKNGSKEIKERRIYISDPILAKTLQSKDSDSSEEIFTTPSEKSDFDPSENNFTTPSEEIFRPSEEIFTHNNKTSSKKDLSLSSLEEMQIFFDDLLRERNFIIDVKKFYDWCKDEGKLKTSWKNIAKKWVEKPENQIKKSVASKTQTADPEKLAAQKLFDKKQEAAKAVYVKGDEFEKLVGKLIVTQSGFELIAVDSFDVEKWRQSLEEINVKIEVK